MICVTLNMRGLCSGPKRTAIKRIIDNQHVDIFLLQETKIEEVKACEYFLRIKPGWRVSALDSADLSGGTLVAWNPVVGDFSPYRTCAGILLSRYCKGFENLLHILNIYAPCRERKCFWDEISRSGCLNVPNLILEGDLNFIMFASEVLGGGFSLDDLFE